MIAHNGFISIHFSSRRVTESTVEGKIKSDWFKANVCVRIFLSYSRYKVVVKVLKLESLSDSGHQKERISDCISNKRFVYQFVCYDIRISSESLGYFLPILNKLFMKVASSIIEFIENISHIITHVVFCPFGMITFIPIWLS